MLITNIFSSFIAYEQMTLDLERLKTYCYNLQSVSTGRILSNYGGWQSEDLPLDATNTAEFRDRVTDKISEVLKNLGLTKEFVISNYWININGKGDFNRPHRHGFSTISGVFYVSAPPNSGKLVLRNPNHAHGFCIDEKIVTDWNQFNSFTWEIEPEPNKLLLWPAWVDHYTLPNNSDESRISIAFNVLVSS
jgi:uncharacterized protein (TIGR02466 family)